jgi:hypothetical protein
MSLKHGTCQQENMTSVNPDLAIYHTSMSTCSVGTNSLDTSSLALLSLLVPGTEYYQQDTNKTSRRVL